MKKDKKDDLRSEYSRESLGTGVRGKYLKDYQEGTNLVLLNPEIAEFFDTDEDVNEALRSLIELARKTTDSSKHPGRHIKSHS